MTDFKPVLQKLHDNLATLAERQAKYAGNAPLALLNQIEDHKRAIALTEEARAGRLSEAAWREELRSLLVALEGHIDPASGGVVIGDIAGNIQDSVIVGRDVIVQIVQQTGLTLPDSRHLPAQLTALRDTLPHLSHPAEQATVESAIRAVEQALAALPQHEAAYLDRIQDRFGEEVPYYIPLAGETTETAPAPPSQAAAPRSARRRRRRAQAEYHEWIPSGQEIKRVKLPTLRDGVDKYPCLILLGDPGAGKTTALEHLAHQIASERPPSNSPLHKGGESRASSNPDRVGEGGESFPSSNPDRVGEGREARSSSNPDRVGEGGEARASSNPDRVGEGGESLPPPNRGRVGEGVLPLPLRLSDFSPGLSVEEFILQGWAGSEQAGYWGATELAANLEGYLDAGRLFILFDALNEMPSEGYSGRVLALRRFIDRWSPKGNRFLVTCRVLDYGEELAGLQRVEIQPLNEGQIEAFLQKELPDGWPALWASLTDQTAGERRLLELARNPYILTMMIDVFAEQGELGRNQAELMERFTRILLSRDKAKYPPEQWLDADIQREALSILAFEMQDKPDSGTRVKRYELEPLLPEKIQPGQRPIPCPPLADVLSLAANAHIIEMPVDRSSVRFYHQLLQEYFAARALVKRVADLRGLQDLVGLGDDLGGLDNLVGFDGPSDLQGFKNLAGHAASSDLQGFKNLAGHAASLDLQGFKNLAGLWRWPWLESEMPLWQRPDRNYDPLPPPPPTGWEETTILAAGLMPENDDQLLHALLRVNPVLAGRCLDEGRANVDKATRQAVIEALLATIARPDVALRVRIAAGEVLGYLGDPRLGQMVTIPAGEFWMGEGKGKHKLSLPEYQIGAYPLTNVEFSRFIEAGGYTERQRRWWTEAGWQRKEKDNWTEPRYWHDSRFNKPNQPVVGVSWYECVAYCRWVSAETGHSYRLPTEAEWEKAVRGSDGRTYPWGDTFEPSRLNAREGEQQVWSTTPVGIYPTGVSPFGLFDGAGNVWEWCATEWGKAYPYDVQEDEWAIDYVNRTNVRVLRGGSWLSNRSNARCAFRDRIDVGYGNYDDGMRLVSPI